MNAVKVRPLLIAPLAVRRRVSRGTYAVILRAGVLRAVPISHREYHVKVQLGR